MQVANVTCGRQWLNRNGELPSEVTFPCNVGVSQPQVFRLRKWNFIQLGLIIKYKQNNNSIWCLGIGRKKHALNSALIWVILSLSLHQPHNFSSYFRKTSMKNFKRTYLSVLAIRFQNKWFLTSGFGQLFPPWNIYIRITRLVSIRQIESRISATLHGSIETTPQATVHDNHRQHSHVTADKHANIM